MSWGSSVCCLWPQQNLPYVPSVLHAPSYPWLPTLFWLIHVISYLFTAFSVHVMCFPFYAFSVLNDNFQGCNLHM
jgi:hypothetical protein